MKFLKTYWAQITGILTILALLFGWCWRLAAKFDSILINVQQNASRLDDHEKILEDHDATLDEHSDSILLLKDHEELRQKGLLK